MIERRLAAVSGVLVSFCLLTASASAQVRFWTRGPSGTGTLMCATAGDCTGSGICSMLSCTPLTTSDGETVSACLPDNPFFCCSDSLLCPLTGTTSVCVHDPVAPVDQPGVCLPADPSLYCGSTAAMILSCFRNGAGSLVPHPMGDCDEDGVINHNDDCICETGVPENNGCPPLPDAGVRFDGGANLVDAFVPIPDAGPGDAGVTPVIDAATPIDSGAIDGGPIAGRYGGGGGCACSAASHGGSGWAIGIAIAFVATLRRKRE